MSSNLTRPKKILVPVDFSECSRPAIERAASFAKKLGAEVHVLHVWEVPEFVPPEIAAGGMSPSGPSLAALVERASSEKLSRLVTEAGASGVSVNKSINECGVPSRTIVRLAAEGDYDLLVLGTHGRTGFTHALLGSVAEKIVRRAPCPVLTLTGAANAHGASVRRILAPVNYSDLSGRALLYAAELASRLGAELDVVHVWDRPRYVSEEVAVRVAEGAHRPLGDLIRENAEQQMKDFLAALRQQPGGDALGAVTHRLLSGEPSSTLLGELDKGGHDLVVVGTHGRGGLKHVLLGSVAERLVRLAPVSVLTVPPPRERARGTASAE